MPKTCFACEQTNPDGQTFCGQCGAVLSLKEYVAQRVGDEVSKAVRDRDILETESSIRVFERAWGWVKIVGSIAAVLLAILGGGVLWKVSDWWTAVEKAKQGVAETASKTTSELSSTSSRSIGAIQAASRSAVEASNKSSTDSLRLATEMHRSVEQTQHQLASEADAVRADVGRSRAELEAANKLKPEFDQIRSQLAKATDDLAAQQKILSSSEDFAKQVFSSHVTQSFTISDFVMPNTIVVPRLDENTGNSIVYLLLPSTPIQGSLQLQFHIYVQPPNSYYNIHNLVIFFWGDPPNNLKTKPLTLSYFPESSDHELIKAITLREGRVYADDQPMPKFNQPDPEFKGNKWIKLQP